MTGNFKVEQALEVLTELDKNISKEQIDIQNEKFIRITTPIISNQLVKTENPSKNDTLNTLVITWPTLKYGSEESLILEVVAYALDDILDKEASLKEISKQRNSSYLYRANRYAGQFGLFVSFPETSKHDQIDRILQKTLDRLKTKGLTQDEILNGLELLKKDIDYMHNRLGFEYSRTELIGKGWLFNKNPNSYLLNMHQQVNFSKDKINNLLAQFLDAPHFSVLFQKQNLNN